jgi:putative ABC transport system permease protein
VSSGVAFAHFVAEKLNFNILTNRLPIHIYIYLATAGLLLPILLSLPALLKGVRVSVYEALSDYGIQQENPGKNKSVSVAQHLPTILVLAFRNTLRRKKRLIITVLTMALGVAIFSTGFNVRQSLWVLLSDVRDSMKHDVQVVFRDQIPKDRALAPFNFIDNLSRIETWNGGKGELQNRVVSTEDSIGIVALPYNTDLLRLKVKKGSWLQGTNEPEVVMNQQALEAYRNPEVGDDISLKIAEKQLTAKLVGVVWEFDKAKIYIDQRQYDAFANPGHLVNSLMFVAKDKSYNNIMTMKKEIEKDIAASDLNVLYVTSQADRVKVIYDHLNIILMTIVFLALTVLIVSALGMASATGINIMERTREIGVLRAIGATPGMIYKLFVYEGMIISVTSVILGLMLSWPLSIVASKFFGDLMLGNGALLPFAFSAYGFWITLITTIIFGWLASRIPARRAIQVSTREALTYE